MAIPLHPIVEGEIELKQLIINEAEELFTLVDKNRNYLRKWLSWVDNNKTIEDTQQFIHNSLEKAVNGKGADFGIYYNKKLAGTIGFHELDTKNKKTTIGYWLDESSQHKGIMTCSVKILLHFAFDSLGINRIQINCALGNMKSSAIPTRLGFKKEGIVRQCEWLNDHFVDWEQYSLLKEEYLLQKNG